MFRETLQVIMCLSVLISSSVSLHMVRDAYHRPLSGLNPLYNDPAIIDSQHTSGNTYAISFLISILKCKQGTYLLLLLNFNCIQMFPLWSCAFIPPFLSNKIFNNFEAFGLHQTHVISFRTEDNSRISSKRNQYSNQGINTMNPYPSSYSNRLQSLSSMASPSTSGIANPLFPLPMALFATTNNDGWLRWQNQVHFFFRLTPFEQHLSK